MAGVSGGKATRRFSVLLPSSSDLGFSLARVLLKVKSASHL